MLRVFTGSYRALEKEWLDDVGRIKREDPMAPVLLVSPSGQLITRLQSQLARERPAALNIHAMSFYALSERLLAGEPSPAGTVVADPALYAEVISGLLEGAGEHALRLGSYFRPEGRPVSKGLPAALASTLRDMRDAGVSAANSLRAALEGHLGEATGEAAPTLELYALSADVLKKHGLLTHADQLRLAAERVPFDPWIASQKAVYLYGFYDLTGVQLDWVMSFAQHANVRVFFYHEALPAAAYSGRLLEDPAFAGKTGSRAALAATPLQPPTEIWNCSGLYDEVWLAAKKILSWSAAGVPYSEMIVTARALGPYLSTLRDVFDAHRIPYATTQEEPVGSYPLVKWVRQLFLLHSGDYPFRAVFDVLNSPYIRLRAAGGLIDAASLPAWEQIARHAGIVTGWKSWNERLSTWSASRRAAGVLEELAAHISADQATNAAASLHRVLSSLHDDFAAGGDAPSWTAHAAWGKALLEKWFEWPPDATADERLLWTGVLDSLQSLAALDALKRPVSRNHFLDVWNDKLDHLSIALAPSNNQGVRVIDIMTARGLQFRHAAVLGLNEKSFPRLIREDPFLSDAARSALSGALGSRLPRKLDGYQEEKLLFHLATQLATDGLHLSYQRSDEEGKALIPSIYLRECTGPGVSRHHLPRAAKEKSRQIPLEHWTPKEALIELNREGMPSAAAFCDAAGFDTPLYSALTSAQDALESFRAPLGAYDGVVGGSAALRERSRLGFSPNSLSDLVQCPFRYFAAKILDLEPLESVRSSGELAADVSGKLIHRILESFFRRWRDQTGVRVSVEKSRGLLDEVCEKTFQSFRETSADLYPVAWRAAQEAIRQRLQTFIQSDVQELLESGFRPMYFEQEIDGKIVGFTDALKDRPFHGRVDRIDLRESAGKTEYRVVDYKTGRPTNATGKTETAVLRGKYLQLPVYLGALQDWLEKKLGRPVQPYEAAFYNLADRERGDVSPSLKPDFFEIHGGALEENLAGLVSLVEQGIFYVRPSADMEYCSWCEFKQVCRKQHKPTAARSETSAVRKKNDLRLLRKAESND